MNKGVLIFIPILYGIVVSQVFSEISDTKSCEIKFETGQLSSIESWGDIGLKTKKISVANNSNKKTEIYWFVKNINKYFWDVCVNENTVTITTKGEYEFSNSLNPTKNQRVYDTHKSHVNLIISKDTSFFYVKKDKKRLKYRDEGVCVSTKCGLFYVSDSFDRTISGTCSNSSLKQELSVVYEILLKKKCLKKNDEFKWWYDKKIRMLGYFK